MFSERTTTTADENELEDSLDSQTVDLALDRGAADRGGGLAAGADPGAVRRGPGSGDRVFAAGGLAGTTWPGPDRFKPGLPGRGCGDPVRDSFSARVSGWQHPSAIRPLSRSPEPDAGRHDERRGGRASAGVSGRDQVRVGSSTPPATGRGENSAPRDSGEPANRLRKTTAETPADPVAFWARFLRSNLRLLGGWLISGLGGLVGLVGSTVIVLSFLFYMLSTRAELVGRLLRVLFSLGMRPRREGLNRIRSDITTFAAFVSMVSICGAIITGTTAWLLGVPQPFLWGLVFGLLGVRALFRADGGRHAPDPHGHDDRQR